MKTLIKNARVILLDEVVHGWLLFEDNMILSLGEGDWGGDEQEIEVIDAKGDYLSPGFIEIHTHGAGGAAFDGSVSQLDDPGRKNTSGTWNYHGASHFWSGAY